MISKHNEGQLTSLLSSRLRSCGSSAGGSSGSSGRSPSEARILFLWPGRVISSTVVSSISHTFLTRSISPKPFLWKICEYWGNRVDSSQASTVSGRMYEAWGPEKSVGSWDTASPRACTWLAWVMPSSRRSPDSRMPPFCPYTKNVP